MKKVLLTLLIIAPAICFSQTIKERKTDKFNGIKTISTSEERLIVSFSKAPIFAQGVVFMDEKEKLSQSTLYFNFLAQGVGSLVPHESSITLLLDNGESMEIKYDGKYNLYSSGERVYFYGNLDNIKLNALSERLVTDIRVSGVADFQIKEKQQPLIGNICKLLIKELPQDSENNSAATSETKGSVADELKKLKNLLDSGAITQEEYDAQKKKLLN